MKTLVILLIIISLLITTFNIIWSIPILKYELKENKRMGYDTRETIPHYMLFIVLSFIPIYNVTLLIETFNDYINIRNGSN